jgi:MoxR-like ATPase
MEEFTAVVSRKPLKLQPPLAENHKDATRYQPAPGLREAMDVAMMLGVPLLLTGAPGTGKTRAAHWLSASLGEQELLRYNVKSSTAGSDLLYSFDDVARFRDATQGRERPLVDYLHFNALGAAILRAAGGDRPLITALGTPLSGDVLARNSALMDQAFGPKWRETDGVAPVSLLRPNDADFAEARPEHRVVLIDELDKAPRDTPNDLLVEVEEMQFFIPELGVGIKADPAFRPIVVITSNSEKSLPDPFLRRCAYFDIPFPDDATLRAIIDGSIDRLSGGGDLVSDALNLFERLRSEGSGIRRVPGTAELLAWLDILVRREGCNSSTSLRTRVRTEGERIGRTLGAMFKGREDSDTARRILADWAALS